MVLVNRILTHDGASAESKIYNFSPRTTVKDKNPKVSQNAPMHFGNLGITFLNPKLNNMLSLKTEISVKSNSQLGTSGFRCTPKHM